MSVYHSTVTLNLTIQVRYFKYFKAITLAKHLSIGSCLVGIVTFLCVQQRASNNPPLPCAGDPQPNMSQTIGKVCAHSPSSTPH